MRIVSLLSMWVRLIVDNFRVYDEMNNSASRPRATSLGSTKTVIVGSVQAASSFGLVS